MYSSDRRKFVGLSVVLPMVLALITPFGTVSAQFPTVDQQQPVVNTAFTFAIGGTSQQKLAQVVTAGLTGVLTEVRFPLACSPGTDLKVEIQGVSADRPNGVVLTSQIVPSGSLPPPVPATFRGLVFSSPAFFTSGDKFAIVLRNASAGSCGVDPGPVGDPYAGGDAFFDALPNLPGIWETISTGTGINDTAFQTVVNSTVSVPQILVAIKGMKFNDMNGNHVKDAGEPSLSGWTINLRNGTTGALIASTTTGSGGNYSFANIGAGIYKICEVLQAGWNQTFPTLGGGCTGAGEAPLGHLINATSGQNVTGKDFGNFKKFTITGTKFHDMNGNRIRDPSEPGLSGWIINLRNATTGALIASTVTGVNGSYSFANLGPGTYRICEVLQTGWNQTLPIFGACTGPGEGQKGYFVFGVSGLNRTRNFANFKLITVSGMKFNDLNGNHIRDANETGLSGWGIRLYNATTGALLTSTVTGSGGNYNFSNVGPGKYRICEVLQAGWNQTFPVFGATCTGLNEAPKGYNFTAISGVNQTSKDFGNHDHAPPTVAVTSVKAPADGFLPSINYTSFPAVVGSRPVNVTGNVSDNVGVASITVNGTPAIIFGNSWKAANIALAVGSNTLNVMATDTSGNTALASVIIILNLDLDGDGIRNNVDGNCLTAPPTSQSNATSNRFCDQLLGGKTSGHILSLGAGISIKIADATPNPTQGVNVTVTGPANQSATLKIDGSNGTITLFPGIYLISDPLQTTTIQVLQGAAQASFVVDSTTVAIVIGSGSTASITETFTNGNLTGLTATATQGSIAINGATLTQGQRLNLPIKVSIDIKPGSDPNSINPKSKGRIPVAILSRSNFSAPNQVNTSSLTFGRTGNEQSLAFCNKNGEDVNGDGLLDLVCHFDTEKTGLQVGDTEGALKGKTVDGLPIEGRDSIKMVNTDSVGRVVSPRALEYFTPPMIFSSGGAISNLLVIPTALPTLQTHFAMKRELFRLAI